MMTVLDLFSGIGGFSLGLERAGMETMAFCENDPFCRKVLAKHWPGVPIHENIEELNGKQYRGSVDLVCGGFPCQPFSVAGNQRGSEDDRALWPEMLRVIREVEPAWIICENVPGIINMELDNCLSSLENSGYSCQTFVVPACAVDAPHRRDRVWIIASHTNFSSKPVGSEYAGQSGQLDVADTRSQGVHKRRGSSSSSEESGDKGRVRRDGLSSREGEEEQTVADTIGATGRGRGLHTDTSDKGREASRARATRLQSEDGETQPDHVESGGKDVADTHGNDGRGGSGSQPRGRHSRVEHGGGGSGQLEREPGSSVADTRFQPEHGPTDSKSHKKYAFDEGQETGVTDRGSGIAGQNFLADAEGEFSERTQPEGNRRGESEISAGNRSSNSSNRGRTKEDVADSGSEGLQGPEREIVSGEERQSGRYIAECGEDVADPPGSRQPGQGEPEYTSNQEAHGEGKTNPSLDVSVRNERGAQSCLGGMAAGVSIWLDEPEGIPRVINGCPDRTPRLKALGNAVVPQVVEALGRFILDEEMKEF